jgi:hypothetical protein
MLFGAACQQEFVGWPLALALRLKQVTYEVVGRQAALGTAMGWSDEFENVG